MKNKYLPSKEFINRLIFLIIFVAGVFAVYKTITFIKNKYNHKGALTTLNIAKTVTSDSNNNGIPDWEERLWGLNPKGNGKENKAIIMLKRATIRSNTNLKDNNETLTKNETLSREFFATIMSLQQTGKLDSTSMAAIANSISQKIGANPIPDKYQASSLKLVTPSPETNGAYFSAFANLVDKYKNEDIGSELTLIIQGLAYNNSQILSLVKPIAEAYKNFAQELARTPVPTNIASIDLSIINDYDKIGQSIEGLAQLQTDPILGMQSLIHYKKYTDNLSSQIDKLSNTLKLQKVL